jgi:hypothetical protein
MMLTNILALQSRCNLCLQGVKDEILVELSPKKVSKKICHALEQAEMYQVPCLHEWAQLQVQVWEKLQVFKKKVAPLIYMESLSSEKR